MHSRLSRRAVVVGLLVAVAAPVWMAAQALVVDVNAASGANRSRRAPDDDEKKDPEQVPEKPPVIRETFVFLGWQAVEGPRPTIYVSLGRRKGRKVARLPVENTEPRNRKEATPPADIASLAESLRLGQEVEATLEKTEAGIVLTGMETLGDAPSETKAGDVAFEFVRSRPQRVDDQTCLTISAKLKEHTVEFVVPNEPQSEEDRKKNRNKPNPPEEIAEAIKAYRPGDLVAIDYKMRDYRCEVEAVRRAEVKTEGEFVSHVPRAGGDVKAVVQILQGREMLILFISAEKAEAIAASVAEFKRNDPVEVTYQRINRRTWLTGIRPASKANDAADSQDDKDDPESGKDDKDDKGNSKDGGGMKWGD